MQECPRLFNFGFMKKHYYTLLAGVLLHLSLFAQGVPADSTRRDSLREIVVTATRAPADPFLLPETIRRVQTGAARAAADRSAPEAMIAVPGIWVQKTNHGGGSPFLRGLTGNQTLILVDGIRLNNATFRYGPNQYLNTIDPFLLEAIETLHGSGSVQYGTDAMGGVVQLLSAPAEFSDKKHASGQLITRLASHDMEQSLRAEGGWHAPNAAILVGTTLRRFGDLRGGDTTGVQAPSGYREYAWNLKARFRISPRVEITAAHQSLAQQHVPVFHKVALENFAINEFHPQERALSYLRAEQRVNQSWLYRNTFTAYRQTSQEGRNSQKNNSNALRREQDNVETLGFLWQADSRWNKRWSSQSGVEIYRDLVRSTRKDTDIGSGIETTSRGLYPDGAHFLNYSTFSLHQWKTSRWVWQGGLRWNGYAVQIEDEDLGLIHFSGQALVGSAGVVRQWNRRVALFASAHTAFRAPNIDDMGTLGIVDFRYEVPNYNLRAERAYNLQSGVRVQGQTFSGDLAVFRNELRGLITRVRVDTQVIQGYPVYQKVNTGQAYVHGVEAQGRIKFSARLTAEAGGSWQFGHDLTRQEPLRRIPPLNGRFQIGYQQPRWGLAAEALGASAQKRLAKGDVDDNRIPSGGTPGWWVANVHAHYRIGPVALHLSAQNLLNRDYRYHGSGVNGYGRSVWLRVVGEIGRMR